MCDCVFCKIANENSERKIYENSGFFSILDKNPVTNGHCLIISKKHFETVLDIPSSLGTELLDCIKETALKLMKKYDSKGFNVVNNNFKAAGQVVNHFHFHIIPRKENDGLRMIG